MSETLPDLLREWSERAPGECRYEHHRTRPVFVLAAEPKPFLIVPVDGPPPQERALILWHVLACIKAWNWFAARTPDGWVLYKDDTDWYNDRAHDPSVWSDDPSVWSEPSWIGTGYDGDDAERLLSAYLAALRALAPSPDAP